MPERHNSRCFEGLNALQVGHAPNPHNSTLQGCAHLIRLGWSRSSLMPGGYSVSRSYSDTWSPSVKSPVERSPKRTRGHGPQPEYAICGESPSRDRPGPLPEKLRARSGNGRPIPTQFPGWPNSTSRNPTCDEPNSGPSRAPTRFGGWECLAGSGSARTKGKGR